MTVESEPYQPSSDVERAFKYSLWLLSRMDYSQKKLAQKLESKDYTKDVISTVLSKLISKQYLREDYYARAKAKSLLSKNFSATYVIKVLREENLTMSLDEIYQIYDELGFNLYDQIRAILDKKMPRVLPSDKIGLGKLKNKLFTQIVRKGHSFHDAKDILSELLAIKTC